MLTRHLLDALGVPLAWIRGLCDRVNRRKSLRQLLFDSLACSGVRMEGKEAGIPRCAILPPPHVLCRNNPAVGNVMSLFGSFPGFQAGQHAVILVVGWQPGSRWYATSDHVPRFSCRRLSPSRRFPATPIGWRSWSTPRLVPRRRRAWADRLAERLRQQGFKTELFTDLAAATSQANRWHAEGCLRTLVGAGGDGTAAELVNRTDEGVPMTLLPAGNSNLLARYFHLSQGPRDSLPHDCRGRCRPDRRRPGQRPHLPDDGQLRLRRRSGPTGA